MAKIVIAKEPTFKVDIPLPTPGKSSKKIAEFEFVWMAPDEFAEFVDGLRGKVFADAVLEITRGWNLDLPLTAEGVGTLLDTYMGSGSVVLDTFIREQRGAKLGN